MPFSASTSLKVVLTDTESITASTATPAGHLLFERDAQFVERALQLGVDLIHRTELLLGLGAA